MSSEEVFSNEIERKAKEYAKRPAADLEELFWIEMQKVESGAGAPVRSSENENFWHGVKNRLVAYIVKNRDVANVTLGMITSQVLTALTSLGVNLSAYQIPIAIFVAIVARSVWDELEARSQARRDRP